MILNDDRTIVDGLMEYRREVLMGLANKENRIILEALNKILYEDHQLVKNNIIYYDYLTD